MMWSSPPKQHTSSDTVETTDKGRPDSALNICKTALHTTFVCIGSSHKHRFINIYSTWNNSEGNVEFQTLPVLRLTPKKDKSTPQLHTLAVPTSSKEEVIYRKLCKAQIAEEIPHTTIMQSKQKLWSDVPLHYSVVLRWYFSSR